MTMLQNFALSAAAVAGLATAMPSQAVVTTFASFNATSTRAIVFKNNGNDAVTSPASARSYNSNGLGGTLYTSSSANTVGADAGVPGSVLVSFSYLNLPAAAMISNVNAMFTLNATTAQVATRPGNFADQVIDSGSFSFKSTQAYTINGITYAAGANLLSATFGDAEVYGPRGSTSGTFGAATSSGSSITYTSDILDFSTTINRDFSYSLSGLTSFLTNINRGLNYNGSSTLTTADDHALRSFRATSTGSFSSDPAPLVNGVPEPAVWGMMIVGFGVVGFQSRRRRSIKSVTA